MTQLLPPQRFESIPEVIHSTVLQPFMRDSEALSTAEKAIYDACRDRYYQTASLQGKTFADHDNAVWTLFDQRMETSVPEDTYPTRPINLSPTDVPIQAGAVIPLERELPRPRPRSLVSTVSDGKDVVRIRDVKTLQEELAQATQQREITVAEGTRKVSEAKATAASIKAEAQIQHDQIVAEAQEKTDRHLQEAQERSEQHKFEKAAEAQAYKLTANQKDSRSKQSLQQFLGQNAAKHREDVVAAIEALMNRPGFDEVYLADAENEAAEIIGTAGEYAAAIIDVAKLKNEHDLSEAINRAEGLQSNAEERANQIVAAAQAEAAKALRLIDVQIAELKQQLAAAEKSIADTRRAQMPIVKDDTTFKAVPQEVQELQAAQKVQRPPVRASIARKKLLTPRRLVAAGLAGALIAGVAAASEISSGSSQSAALQVVATPHWKNYPVGVEGWRDKIAAAISDPRVAVNGHNYLLGDGTAENPGYGYVLSDILLATTAGNFHDSLGLLPMASQNRSAIATKLKLSNVTERTGEANPKNNHIETVAEAKDNIEEAAYYANFIFDCLLHDPVNRAAYLKNPAALFATFMGSWAIDGSKIDPKTLFPVLDHFDRGRQQIVVNLAEDNFYHRAQSEQLQAMLGVPKWLSNFKAGEQAVVKGHVITLSEGVSRAQ